MKFKLNVMVCIQPGDQVQLTKEILRTQLVFYCSMTLQRACLPSSQLLYKYDTSKRCWLSILKIKEVLSKLSSLFEVSWKS